MEEKLKKLSSHGRRHDLWKVCQTRENWAWWQQINKWWSLVSVLLQLHAQDVKRRNKESPDWRNDPKSKEVENWRHCFGEVSFKTFVNFEHFKHVIPVRWDLKSWKVLVSNISYVKCKTQNCFTKHSSKSTWKHIQRGCALGNIRSNQYENFRICIMDNVGVGGYSLNETKMKIYLLDRNKNFWRSRDRHKIGCAIATKTRRWNGSNGSFIDQ